MISSPTLEKLRTMGLKTFANEFEVQLLDPSSYSQLGFEERLGLLVDSEWNQKQTNKLNRCISKEHFGISTASIEGIEYLSDRNLDKAQIIRFSTCNFINENHHILITGATGCGKTYLACAIGKSACRKFKNVKYIRLSELLDELKIARINGNTKNVVNSYCKLDLLIIDDWLIRKINMEQIYDLFEIIQGRGDGKLGKVSMIICSQYAPDEWYDQLNPDPDDESPIADAIMDRIAYNAYKISIGGNISMRERHGLAKSKKQDENN